VVRVEVQEEPEVQASCSQVSEHLCFKDGVKAIDAFHFDDYVPFDDEVDLVVADPVALVLNGHRRLPLEGNVLVQKLQCERFLVGPFTQAWTKDPMDGNRAADHSPRNC
jgi:hypothetical protein